MVDFFINNHLINELIRKTCENPKKYIASDEAIWFNTTKQMLNTHTAMEIHQLIEKAIEEESDKQWFEHKYPRGFFKEDWVYPKRRSVIKLNLKNSQTRKFINDNLKITEVAKEYGLIVKKQKAVCPFHDDTDPSLSFSDKKNVFNCFGCGTKGDLITFIRLMENLK